MKTHQNLPKPEDFAQTIARSMWGPSLQNKPFRSHMEIIAESFSLPHSPRQSIALPPEPQSSRPNSRNLETNFGSTASGVNERSLAICGQNANMTNFSVRFDRHPVTKGLVWAAVKK